LDFYDEVRRPRPDEIEGEVRLEGAGRLEHGVSKALTRSRPTGQARFIVVSGRILLRGRSSPHLSALADGP
jgi:hypothetical protein